MTFLTVLIPPAATISLDASEWWQTCYVGSPTLDWWPPITGIATSIAIAIPAIQAMPETSQSNRAIV
jgi:hypothetical protein